jgi:hypothetical protein
MPVKKERTEPERHMAQEVEPSLSSLFHWRHEDRDTALNYARPHKWPNKNYLGSRSAGGRTSLRRWNSKMCVSGSSSRIQWRFLRR